MEGKVRYASLAGQSPVMVWQNYIIAVHCYQVTLLSSLGAFSLAVELSSEHNIAHLSCMAYIVSSLGL